MYKRILVATDGSNLAERAVNHGVRLAQTLNAEVVFVTVTETWLAADLADEYEDGENGAIRELVEAARRTAERVLDGAQSFATTLGVKSVTRHVQDEPAAEGIIGIAELDECDLIVMASHGRRGLQKVLIGSQTAEVLTYSKVPVLVLR